MKMWLHKSEVDYQHSFHAAESVPPMLPQYKGWQHRQNKKSLPQLPDNVLLIGKSIVCAFKFVATVESLLGIDRKQQPSDH